MLPLIKEFRLNQKTISYLKLILTVIILAAAIVPVAPSQAHAFSGTGNGTEQNPYIITTAAMLDDIRTDLNAYYKLGANIQLTDYTWNPIANFAGVFDGNGYTISGLTINQPLSMNVGFFGNLTATSIVRNVRFMDVNIIGNRNVGSFAGTNFGQISNVFASGSVEALGEGTYDYAGGLVGVNSASITKSISAVNVRGTKSAGYVGGIAGYNVQGTVSQSYATGQVDGLSRVGGLAGYNSNGTVSNSYSTGSVTTTVNRAGGLVGQNAGQVTSSYSTGLVIGSTQSGGLIGINSGTVTNSYWDITSSGQSTSGGGTGKTNEEMILQNTFVDWDFTNIWMMNGASPILGQLGPADPPAVVETAPPTIDIQPVGDNVNKDAISPMLNVVASASDGGSLSYQWYSNITDSNNGGTLIIGATDSSYAAPTTSVGTTFYYVVVTNTNTNATGAQTASVTSNTVAVTVNALTHAAEPQINTQPLGQTVTEGADSPTLSVEASVSDGGTLSYQWYSNTENRNSEGTLVFGATNPSYAPPTSTTGTTYYYVVVTNTNINVTGINTASVTSHVAAITVNTLTSATGLTVAAIDPAGAANDGRTQITVTPLTEAGNRLVYLNAGSGSVTVPYQGEVLSGYMDLPEDGVIPAVNGDIIAVAEVNDSNRVVKFGQATAIVIAEPVHLPTPAGGLTVTSRDLVGKENDGHTLVTVDPSPEAGHRLVYQNLGTDEVSVPNEGDALTGFTDFPSNGIIPAENGEKIVVAEVNSLNRVRKFGMTSAVVVKEPVVTSPLVLHAIAGNQQATLNWNSIEGTEEYQVYQSTTSGSFEREPVTVSNSVYQSVYLYVAGDLINGTTYYFRVTAVNGSGETTASNEVSVQPKTTPAAPVHVRATAGNERATVSFDPPTDNGGGLITGYVVTAMPGGITATGATSPITITGLTNGTEYSFIVQAINSEGVGALSAESNRETPKKSSSGSSSESGSSGSTSSESSKTANESNDSSTKGIDILVNGKKESTGTATVESKDGQSVIRISVDPEKIEQKLASEGRSTVVTIPVVSHEDVIIGQINGETLKKMNDLEAILKLQTESATYTIPTKQIQVASILKQLEEDVQLEDIVIQLIIAKPVDSMLNTINNAAANEGFTLVTQPRSFSISGTYRDQTVEIPRFNAYVERAITIPGDVDPNQITTGIAVEADGTTRHVPTKVVQQDGQYYATINSLTNSTYAVIWNPVEFKDVEGHWAKDAINDMGSRMVINGVNKEEFNPNADITRSEFAAIIVRGLGLKPEEGQNSFADVGSEDWYNAYVQTAYSNGLIQGFEDGKFRPNDHITREQAMVIMAKAMNITGLQADTSSSSLNNFKDRSLVSGWAEQNVVQCMGAGLVSGRTSTEIAPKANVSRAEVAKLVQALLSKSNLI
ncbi:S-layer homology domain-containing protein [Paenibacillus jamilae]|uniref:S-layer homology domain-containing protein n=1 Tax=Paenibacillus jamilae TaxID=114136 RepID=UPI003D287EAC